MRREQSELFTPRYVISIHAPTWGATRKVEVNSSTTLISIHAPTWGATLCSYPYSCSSLYFNPRTHVGCDATINKSLLIGSVFQSTHPRGVRLHPFPHHKYLFQFQSTHPRGVRPKSYEDTLQHKNFNPRTHVGCDRYSPQETTDMLYFNPRTHVGCDTAKGKRITGGTEISIHAPTWGATGVFQKPL